MKKLFFIFTSFLWIITLFSQTSLALADDHVTVYRGEEMDACYSCSNITIDGIEYNGIFSDISDCVPEDGQFYNPATGESRDCDRDSDVPNYVCKYNAIDNPVGFYDPFMTPPEDNGVCSQGTETCSIDEGCLGVDEPAPSECRFATYPGREENCTSQEFCKDGGSADCANFYCVNTLDPNNLTLISYEDWGKENYLKCREQPAGEVFKCGVPEEDDPEACIDPFEEREKRECNNPDGPAPKECFSGWCNKDYKCEDRYAAFNCNYNTTTKEFNCKTALGKINTSPEKFVQNLLQIMLGISGGILLVLIIFNGYKLMTSQGDPERIKDAREGIIAAIAGILLVIFSISLLQLITADILGLPGFG